MNWVILHDSVNLKWIEMFFKPYFDIIIVISKILSNSMEFLEWDKPTNTIKLWSQIQLMFTLFFRELSVVSYRDFTKYKRKGIFWHIWIVFQLQQYSLLKYYFDTFQLEKGKAEKTSRIFCQKLPIFSQVKSWMAKLTTSAQTKVLKFCDIVIKAK